NIEHRMSSPQKATCCGAQSIALRDLLAFRAERCSALRSTPSFCRGLRMSSQVRGCFWFADSLVASSCGHALSRLVRGIAARRIAGGTLLRTLREHQARDG